jgi:hypothetical protein
MELMLYLSLIVFGCLFSLYFQFGLNNRGLNAVDDFVKYVQTSWKPLDHIRFYATLVTIPIAIWWAARCRAQVASVIKNYDPSSFYGILLTAVGYKQAPLQDDVLSEID